MPPVSERQRRAAGRELGLRRGGKKKQAGADRPFGSISTAKLRHFAMNKPDPKKTGPRGRG